MSEMLLATGKGYVDAESKKGILTDSYSGSDCELRALRNLMLQITYPSIAIAKAARTKLVTLGFTVEGKATSKTMTVSHENPNAINAVRASCMEKAWTVVELAPTVDPSDPFGGALAGISASVGVIPTVAKTPVQGIGTGLVPVLIYVYTFVKNCIAGMDCQVRCDAMFTETPNGLVVQNAKNAQVKFTGFLEAGFSVPDQATIDGIAEAAWTERFGANTVNIGMKSGKDGKTHNTTSGVRYAKANGTAASGGHKWVILSATKDESVTA